MTRKICVVAGALGIAGSALVEQLEKQENCEVIGLSRRKPDSPSKSRFVSADLLDKESTVRAIKAAGAVTHVFYAPYAPRAMPAYTSQGVLADEVAPNLEMLQNLVTAVEAASPALRHVGLIQGPKWYGVHLGPYKTPAKEDDPRHMPPNFYYDQQDWLTEHQRGRDWTWTSWRPAGLCGVAVGSAMNQLTALAVYATISRELGLPLRFPGTPGAYRAIYQFTDASLLARAMLWSLDNPACVNQAFNITNGESERWENIWSEVAACFDMPVGTVQTVSLTAMMSDKEPLWAKIRERHNLAPYTLRQLTNWEFADWVYSNSYDQMLSLGKLTRAGWHEVLDAGSMFRQLFADLRARRMIP